MKTIEQDETIIWKQSPYCEEHGAMLKLNGIYRCLGTYKGSSDGVYPKGIKPIKFIERTCNSAFIEKEEDVV